MEVSEARYLVGCCGLYCGLCNKYQSKAPSRCMGCKKGEQHNWCSIWNCCVKQHGYDSCADCEELFSCGIFKRRKVMVDSGWIPAPGNLELIKKDGLSKWLEQQMQRQNLLEELLENYNEGRSMSFYCRATARMPIELINRAIEEAEKIFIDEKVMETDKKTRAKILRDLLGDFAFQNDISLDR